MLARGGLAHAFVHREDISGLGFDGWPSLVPQGTDTAGTLESDIASSAIAAVMADSGAAAQLLPKLDLPAEDRLTSPDLQLTADLARVILGIKAGDADAVAVAADHVLARARDAPEYQLPGLLAAVLLTHATSKFWHGRNDDADTLLHAALAEAERTGPPVIELEVLAATALVGSLRSRPRHAEDAAQRAHSMLERADELSIPPALELAAAARLLIAADISGATAALGRVQLSDTVGADPALALVREIGQAKVLLACGDIGQAREVAHRSTPTELPLLAAQRETLLADTETLLGRPHAALRLLRDYQDSNLAVLAALPGARAHLALHDVRSARNCVRAVLATTSRLVSRYTVVEGMLCEAQIAQLGDDTRHALEMIWAAIELAEGDIVLPFLAAEDVFAPLLARHPALHDRWPRATGSGPVKVAVPAPRRAADLLDPLTEREQVVLRFLATSLSPGEIAGEMCLSVNTVKTHLAAIYRKLAASRRKEAVQRARELELL
jgi:LuxR family transcriptional regulator, maltose regulon positive regulatory protein